MIAHAYNVLISELFGNNASYEELIDHAIKHGVLYNIREKRWDDNVKSSIMSDVVILETVSKIIGMMATCNQFIVPTAAHNIYVD